MSEIEIPSLSFDALPHERHDRIEALCHAALTSGAVVRRVERRFKRLIWGTCLGMIAYAVGDGPLFVLTPTGRLVVQLIGIVILVAGLVLFAQAFVHGRRKDRARHALDTTPTEDFVLAEQERHLLERARLWHHGLLLATPMALTAEGWIRDYEEDDLIDLRAERDEILAEAEKIRPPTDDRTSPDGSA